MGKGMKATLPIPLVLRPNPRQLSPLAANLPQVFLTPCWKFYLPECPGPTLTGETPCLASHTSLLLDSRQEASPDSEDCPSPSARRKYLLTREAFHCCSPQMHHWCNGVLPMDPALHCPCAGSTAAGPGPSLNQHPD